MSTLNYSPPSISLTIGSFDLSPYLRSFSISPGAAEINSYLNWAGEFEISYPAFAADAESEFSEYSNPGRWRRGQQVCTLTLAGIGTFKLRIDEYQYNPYTRTGAGTFTQLLGLLDFDRPAVEVKEVKVGDIGTPIYTAVNALLLEAGKIDGVEVIGQAYFSIGTALEGTIDSPLIAENPIQQAQELCGKQWYWLYVDNSEVVRIKKRPENSGTPIFARSLLELEIDSDVGNIQFSADKVIVTGSRQVAKRNKPEDDSAEENKPIVTRSEKPITEVLDPAFFDPSDDDMVVRYLGYDAFGYLVTEEIKTIEKTYYATGVNAGELEETRTTYVRPISKIIPLEFFRQSTETNIKYNDALQLETALIEVERPIDGTKETIAPAASVFNKERFLRDSGQTQYPGFPLDPISRVERVTQGNPRKRSYILSKAIDPETGQRFEAEPDPEREKPRPKSLFTLETEQLKGEHELTPVGYSTFLPRTHIEEVGFLPSQEVATNLARQIAFREIQRRDSLRFSMPTPREWLTTHGAPFAVADLHDARYVIEAPELNYEEGQLRFEFTGERLGGITAIPDPIPAPIYIPVSGLQIAPATPIRQLVGQAIAPLQLIASGGTSPYSFSGTLPSGITVSSSGLISGTGSSPVDTSYTITVTDATTATATVSVRITIVAVATPTPVVSSSRTHQLSLGLTFGTVASVVRTIAFGLQFIRASNAASRTLSVGLTYSKTGSITPTPGGGSAQINVTGSASSGGQVWVYYTASAPTSPTDLNGAARAVFIEGTDFTTGGTPIDLSTFYSTNGTGFYTFAGWRSGSAEFFVDGNTLSLDSEDPAGTITGISSASVYDSGNGVIFGTTTRYCEITGTGATFTLIFDLFFT